MAAASKLCCVLFTADVVIMAQVWLVALQHIDNLPREKAFFKGPAPLLLSSLSPDDLTFLLLGSDPKTSQVLQFCPAHANPQFFGSLTASFIKHCI